MDAIIFNPFQPRKTDVDAGIEELAASISEHGLLQPIVVRKLGEGYELIAGERRVRACRRLGMKVIPALVREGSDRDSALLALVENLQRQDLCVLDEAEGYRRLIAEFGLTQEEVAGSVGKSQPTVANKLRLLRLPEEVKAELRSGTITERHARALLKLDDAETQVEMMAAVIEGNLNVQQTEDLIAGVLAAPAPEDAEQGTNMRKQRIRVFKDLRIFLNSFREVVLALNRAGLRATLEEEDRGDYIYISITVPKTRSRTRSSGAM